MATVSPLNPRLQFVGRNGHLTLHAQNLLQEIIDRIGGTGVGEVAVTGPASSTDNNIARWNGTQGTALNDSGVTLDSADNISGVQTLTADTLVGTSIIGGSATISGLTATDSLSVGGTPVTPFPQAGELQVFESTIDESVLESGGLVTIVSPSGWKVREIQLTGDGTNFSGGDRLLSISDGVTTYTTIPAATLQTLTEARWGDTGVPFPSTGMMVASVGNIVAEYSGGATDYTAGSCTIAIIAEKQ